MSRRPAEHMVWHENAPRSDQQPPLLGDPDHARDLRAERAGQAAVLHDREGAAGELGDGRGLLDFPPILSRTDLLETPVVCKDEKQLESHSQRSIFVGRWFLWV